MHRYELSDAPWACIVSYFPDRYPDDQPGHPWWMHRRMVNGILWHLHTAAPWSGIGSPRSPMQKRGNADTRR